MKKDKREAQKRLNRQAAETRKLEKKRQLEEELASMDDMDEIPVEEPLEAVEKMDGMPEAAEDPFYAPSPTSFSELDALRMAQEQAEHVRELTWDVQDLVRNILHNPIMAPKEKAQAIQGVGTEFSDRLEMAMKPEEEMQKSIDELELQALLAYDKRHTGFVENVTDWINKKKLTSQARGNLSDADFALVYEEEGKDGKKTKVRKYPIHDKAHVRNALARAAQQIAAGGQAAADARKALPKIRAAAKKFGIEMTMDKEKNAVVIEKDASGDWRWVGWATNKWIDFDGDIIAESAHKEYMEWLDKNREMSPLHLMWHTPGTAREHPVDFWMYEDGFVILSGKLTEKEAEIALKARMLTDMGMSIGALVLERDQKDPRIILKYRMYEVSDLPLENAANPWTDMDTIVKEAQMDKKQYFEELLGKERAEKYLTLTGLKKEALEEAQIESKEKEPATETPAPAEEHVKEPQQTAQVDVQAIVEQVIKETGMTELSAQFAALIEKADKVDALEELVKAMQRDTDEQLAEKISPPANRFAWMTKASASKSDGNVLDEKKPEDENLKKSISPEHWLSSVTGTQPVQ